MSIISSPMLPVGKSEKKWNPQEDEILRAAVTQFGTKNSWQKISERLPGRSNKSCRKRWIHSLDPQLRKGRWTATEDAKLREAIKEHGLQWWKVARQIEGRTDDQCAKRWREKLDPSISRRPWSVVEDQTLMDAWKIHGKKWNVISTVLPGRPAVHCRNRYQSLTRISRRAGMTGTSGETSPPILLASSESFKVEDNSSVGSSEDTSDATAWDADESIADCFAQSSTPFELSNDTYTRSPHSPYSIPDLRRNMQTSSKLHSDQHRLSWNGQNSDLNPRAGFMSSLAQDQQRGEPLPGMHRNHPFDPSSSISFGSSASGNLFTMPSPASLPTSSPPSSEDIPLHPEFRLDQYPNMGFTTSDFQEMGQLKGISAMAQTGREAFADVSEAGTSTPRHSFGDNTSSSASMEHPHTSPSFLSYSSMNPNGRRYTDDDPNHVNVLIEGLSSRWTMLKPHLPMCTSGSGDPCSCENNLRAFMELSISRDAAHARLERSWVQSSAEGNRPASFQNSNPDLHSLSVLEQHRMLSQQHSADSASYYSRASIPSDALYSDVDPRDSMRSSSTSPGSRLIRVHDTDVTSLLPRLPFVSPPSELSGHAH